MMRLLTIAMILPLMCFGKEHSEKDFSSEDVNSPTQVAGEGRGFCSCAANVYNGSGDEIAISGSDSPSKIPAVNKDV